MLIAAGEFLLLDLFIRKRLHDPDAGKRILQRSVDAGDLAAVFHERLLHPAILPQRKQQHAYRHDHQQDRQRHMDIHEQDKRTDDLQ